MSLLRSTKFVRYFTGAARTLILNSAKSAEANLLVNPKALCSANNVVLRDYGTSKKTENLEPLLQKLDSEVRRYGRITKRDIDEIFDEIKAKNDITSSQSLLIIRCCGELVPEELPEQRTLLVQKIWNVLTERGVPMDISHYNALLRVYLENEHPFSPAKFLEELEIKGLEPNRVTYQRLMWRYCQEGDVEGATKVLEKMRELNFPVSEPVLNALVMGHAFHGDTNGAKAVLETMAGAGLQPTNRTYALLACGYAKQGDIDGVENIIKISTEKDAYMTDKDILDIIEHLTLSGHGDKVDKMFPHLQKSFGYNQDVCNLILKLLNKGHEETAKKIMKTMPKAANSDDTLFKGAFFIKQLLRLNRPVDNLIKTCQELKDEDLVPGAFFIAAEGALQQGHVELAIKLFKQLQNEGVEIRQHYYWPLLAKKGKEGDEEGMIQIIREMVKQGCSPNGETLRDYIIPYLMKNDSPENIILKLQIASVPIVLCARNLMVELLDEGKTRDAAKIALRYRPRGQFSLLGRPLLNAVAKTKDIDSFASVLHVISSPYQTNQTEEDAANDETVSEDKFDTEAVGRIVTSACKNLTSPDLCEKLLTAVHAKGLRINTESAQAIEQFIGQNMTASISELLTKITSADLELAPLEITRRVPFTERSSADLEHLYEQAKSRGGNSLQRIQKQLLYAHIKENNVDKANSFLQELKASNFELTVANLAQLYEFHCTNGEIDKAKECNAQIKEKNAEFVLNKYKHVQMAFALLKANRYDEAIQFLKENKFESDEEMKSFLHNSKCWQILNHLAETKDIAKVKEMTDVLLSNNYVEPSNVLLGPLIKVHLLAEDLEGALAEFENCCKLYRSTPWKGELMKQLIMKEDATKLQWLADISTQIHGEVNILHDLVLAFVECGRLRQARRILETPGLGARHTRLHDACQRYVTEGKSEYLEGLLEATKELSHIDRSNIFYHLLVTYCNTNQTDKALGLWTLLQEEGEVPSDQFLLHLGKHLKANNQEVPFVMPEDPTANERKTKEKTDVVRKIVEPKLPQMPTKKQVTDNIERLIHDRKSPLAMDIAIKSIQEGVIPKATVMKFLLKNLAQEGNIEKIQQLGNYISENMRREVTFDDKLTLAIFNRGAGAQHVDNLYEAVNASKSEEDLEIALRKFPRSNALASIMNNEELVQKCHKVAELAASRGQIMPANLLWMEYLLAGKKEQADSLWKLQLSDAKVIVFRRLLQEAHVRKDPQLIENLISCLKSNQMISEGSVGNASSRLINMYLLEEKVEKAFEVYEQAVKHGVSVTSFNKNTLAKLNELAPAHGKQVNLG